MRLAGASVPQLAGNSPLDWLDAGGRLRTLIDLLPPPTRALPGGSDRRDLEDVRRSWLELRQADPTPGWAIAWETIARQSDAYPLGI